MKKATGGQRFVAILIDMIIITIISTLFTKAITSMAKIKSPTIDFEISDTLRKPMENYVNSEILNGTSIEYDDEQLYVYIGMEEVDKILDYFNDYYPEISEASIKAFHSNCDNLVNDTVRYIAVNALLSIGSSIVFFIIYYCVIGYYWSKQTLGRWAMRIRVSTYDGTKPSFGSFILRDLVGYYLLNLLNVCCFAPLIINAVFICGKDGLSIGDKLSNLQMVQYDKDGNIIENDKDNYDYGNFYNKSNVVDEQPEDDFKIKSSFVDDNKIKDADIVDDEDEDDEE